MIGIKKNRYIAFILFILLNISSLSAQINIQTHYLRGRQQLAGHEFTQAILTFNLILQYNPDHAEALFYRGLAKYQLSDYSGAEADFTRSIEIKPYKTEALYYRGLLKVEKNQYLEAFRDIQQAIELDDRHPEYFITRGWLHIEYGDTSGAILDYQKAISLDPYLDNAHLNLSLIYMNQGKYDLATSHCDSAEKINPHNPSLRLTRGNIYQLQEKFADAIEQFNMVLTKDSTHVRAWFFTALCHHKLENYDAALQAYDRTIELNGENALGFYNRGLLQMDHEKNQQALSDFDRVIELSPKNIYAYFIRGIIKTRLEDFAGAEEDFSAAIDLYPGLIHAYQNRSITRMAQNDLKGYTEDKNTVDSLLNIRVPGFDLTELSYLKTITDFNADFTPVERVMNHMVQYSTKDVQMISVFYIELREEQYDQSYNRVNDLSILQYFNDPGLLLELKNYDYPSQTVSLNNQIEKLSSQLPETNSVATDALFNSLLLGWQMKYRDAIRVLDEADSILQDNYLGGFLRGNYNFAIAEIISSIESQEIYSDESNSTVREYYQQAIEDYNNSIELNPDFSYSYYNRAYVRSFIDELPLSVRDYTRCIELKPELGEAYYNRGLLYIFLESQTEGCQDLSKAGELGIEAAYKVIYKFCNE
ncbi:tetratricopeptide repeat protein [Bacteroidota bacterium]